MVARLTLTQLVKVRILLGQLVIKQDVETMVGELLADHLPKGFIVRVRDDHMGGIKICKYDPRKTWRKLPDPDWLLQIQVHLPELILVHIGLGFRGDYPLEEPDCLERLLADVKGYLDV